VLAVDNLEERQRIGDTIRQVRKNKKITQTQLGAEIGVGKVAIANYESGKIKVIPFEKRVKLAEILNIDLDELLYFSEKIASVDESFKRDVEKFIKHNPVIAKDFFESKFYVNIEKLYNEKYDISLDNSRENYEAQALLEALKFYHFMMQHIEMLATNTEYNILLVEFLKVYYPAITKKLDGIFVDFDTFKSQISEDAPIAFTDSEVVPVIYPFDKVNKDDSISAGHEERK
jgi:transcriptional regulator with XRE-family HTH domain